MREQGKERKDGKNVCVCVHVRKRESGINLLTWLLCLKNSS